MTFKTLKRFVVFVLLAFNLNLCFSESYLYSYKYKKSQKVVDNTVMSLSNAVTNEGLTYWFVKSVKIGDDDFKKIDSTIIYFEKDGLYYVGSVGRNNGGIDSVQCLEIKTKSRAEKLFFMWTFLSRCIPAEKNIKELVFLPVSNDENWSIGNETRGTMSFPKNSSFYGQKDFCVFTPSEKIIVKIFKSGKYCVCHACSIHFQYLGEVVELYGGHRYVSNAETEAQKEIIASIPKKVIWNDRF